jgi:hypothetical protein
MLIGTARIPPRANVACRRDGSVPDADRDVAALAWDLTAHALRRAFAVSVGPALRGDGAGPDTNAVARVRIAAARHTLDELRAILDRAASGSYGRCVDCRRVIDAEHLDADLTLQRCLLCPTGER